MMESIAVVALGLVVAIGPARRILQRAIDSQQRATEFAALSQVAATAEAIHLEHLAGAKSASDIRAHKSLAADQRAHARRYRALARKYWWHARLPFLPVAHDTE